jgi:hypothetical protein
MTSANLLLATILVTGSLLVVVGVQVSHGLWLVAGPSVTGP